MATIPTIDEVLEWAGHALPDDYLDLLKTHGGDFCNDRVRLYGVADIIERNETYEVRRFCPGFIAIGDDSGGRALVIALGKDPGPVYLVDYGSMMPDDFHVIALDIKTWVAAGCEIKPLSAQRAPAYRIGIRWEGKMSPSALKVLRALSPRAKDMSLAELVHAFAGGRPFDRGWVVEYKRADTVRRLADAGFIITQEACP